MKVSHRCLGLPRGLGGDAVAGVVVVAPQRRAGGQHAACRVEEASALRAGHLRRNQGLFQRHRPCPRLPGASAMPQAAWSFGQPRPCTGLGFDMARSPRPSSRGPPCCGRPRGRPVGASGRPPSWITGRRACAARRVPGWAPCPTSRCSAAARWRVRSPSPSPPLSRPFARPPLPPPCARPRPWPSSA
eukprot:scaffold67025_cov37-Phaeocystis_antarctica.AAC.3